MPNPVKASFLTELGERYGPFRKLGNSQSLYELHDSRVRLYLRYSKIHGRNQAFYYEGDLYNVVRQGRGVPAVPLVIVGVAP